MDLYKKKRYIYMWEHVLFVKAKYTEIKLISEVNGLILANNLTKNII